MSLLSFLKLCQSLARVYLVLSGRDYRSLNAAMPTSVATALKHELTEVGLFAYHLSVSFNGNEAMQSLDSILQVYTYLSLNWQPLLLYVCDLYHPLNPKMLPSNP